MSGELVPGLSYWALFGQTADGHPRVRRIEIPNIQRDFAQGRDEPRVEAVRSSFLEALHGAVTTGVPLSLDFIYGDIDAEGTFRPLDGQQRLTTLFLLHWYLANRAGCLDEDASWTSLSYATRPGARDFCERLGRARLPAHLRGIPGDPTDDDRANRSSEGPSSRKPKVSAWIIDQAWYRYGWRHDPTIQSMLVMLDSIAYVFSGDDEQKCRTAWDHLTRTDCPAIQFHVLTLPDTGSAAARYITMNSRGKPLTEFEAFKARFESSVEWVGRDKKDELARKLDGPWADLLWRVSSDDLVDDDFMKYIGFVTEICEWLEGRSETGPLGPRTDRIFGGADKEAAGRSLDLLFHAFDTWLDDDRTPLDVEPEFTSLLVPLKDRDKPEGRDRLPLFTRDDVNLLRACCHTFAQMSDQARAFTLGDSLMLYAVLMNRMHGTADFPRRLRMLRNLISASTNELRVARGPGLVRDVKRLVVDGSLNLSTLNQRQVADERRKEEFVADNPDLEAALFHLEDRSLLRGRLACFALEPESFERHARTFEEVMRDRRHWPLLTAALLTKGRYGRDLSNGYFRMGSPEGWTWWRELLTEANDADTKQTRATLAAALEDIASRDGPLPDRLQAIRHEWLTRRNEQRKFDWRYYLVRYDAMREGSSGVYFSFTGQMGYMLCMLSTKTILGYYRDPYLHAMCQESGVGPDVQDPLFRFSVPRWMRLKASGTELRFRGLGMEIRPPEDPEQAATLSGVLKVRRQDRNAEGNIVIEISQSGDGHRIDTEDRVQLGAAILRDMGEAGL